MFSLVADVSIITRYNDEMTSRILNDSHKLYINCTFLKKGILENLKN